MSFQDVGKPGAAKRPARENNVSALSTIDETNGPIGVGNDGNQGYAQVSDGILQYQRNVGILERIIKQVGTKGDGPVLETQYKVQMDVIRQLGAKIENQLRAQELNMQSMSRTEQARSRSTHVKLTRDFRRVEATVKNLQMEWRRRKSLAEAQRHEREEEERRRLEEAGVDEAEIRRQIQIQEDKFNEEIMREREEEIRKINQGMHQVNEIYKDLAHIVGSQQEQIDQIEDQMEDANINAEKGLKAVEKANAHSSSNCVIS